MLLVFINCEDDEGPLPPRDVKIQTIEDDAALVNYLQTHFYNYDDFAYDLLIHSSGSVFVVGQTYSSVIHDQQNRGKGDILFTRWR